MLILPRQVVCGVCANAMEVHDMMSVSTYGPSDLDLRPPPDLRNSLSCFVSQCKGCGYCAADISVTPPAPIVNALQSPAYLRLLHDPQLRETARVYTCITLLARLAGDFAQTMLNARAVAWICDDDVEQLYRRYFLRPAMGVLPNEVLVQVEPPYPQPQREYPIPMDDAELLKQRSAITYKMAVAVAYRQQAIAALRQCQLAEIKVLGDATMQNLVLLDLLRRCGQFAEALALVERMLQEQSRQQRETEVGDALRFQQQRALEADIYCYNFGHVERAEPGWQERARLRKAQAQELAQQQREEAAKNAWKHLPNAFPAALAARIRDVGDPSDLKLNSALLSGLGMPDGVVSDLVKLGVAQGWPARQTLAALGLAIIRVMPKATSRIESEEREWQVLARGHEQLVDYLAYCFRCISPNLWHYWPPMAAQESPPAPSYPD